MSSKQSPSLVVMLVLMSLCCSKVDSAPAMCVPSAISMDRNSFEKFLVAPLGVTEHSYSASGKFGKKAHRDDLESVVSFPGILHFIEDVEAFYMTKNCKGKLMQLASLVNAYWQGACTIKLFRAFSSKDVLQLSKFSLHFEGRALDLTLEKNKNALASTPIVDCRNQMKKLAWIAFKYAEFDYASLANHPNHLHLSCRKSS